MGFQRTLRIPDHGSTYPLPAGLGFFPLRNIDDFGNGLPGELLERGGVVMPMYQSEALWIYFDSAYPCAIKVAAGKINAVTGKKWDDALAASPQNYVVVPEQPWLDGFAVSKGVIRQFVAMPLGSGYSVEEQIIGGLQLQVFAMKPETCFNSSAVARKFQRSSGRAHRRDLAGGWILWGIKKSLRSVLVMRRIFSFHGVERRGQNATGNPC